MGTYVFVCYVILSSAIFCTTKFMDVDMIKRNRLKSSAKQMVKYRLYEHVNRPCLSEGQQDMLYLVLPSADDLLAVFLPPWP